MEPSCFVSNQYSIRQTSDIIDFPVGTPNVDNDRKRYLHSTAGSKCILEQINSLFALARVSRISRASPVASVSAVPLDLVSVFVCVSASLQHKTYFIVASHRLKAGHCTRSVRILLDEQRWRSKEYSGQGFLSM